MKLLANLLVTTLFTISLFYTFRVFTGVPKSNKLKVIRFNPYIHVMYFDKDNIINSNEYYTEELIYSL